MGGRYTEPMMTVVLVSFLRGGGGGGVGIPSL